MIRQGTKAGQRIPRIPKKLLRWGEVGGTISPSCGIDDFDDWATSEELPTGLFAAHTRRPAPEGAGLFFSVAGTLRVPKATPAGMTPQSRGAIGHRHAERAGDNSRRIVGVQPDVFHSQVAGVEPASFRSQGGPRSGVGLPVARKRLRCPDGTERERHRPPE